MAKVRPQSNARQSNWHKHTWHDRPFIASLPSSSWDWRRSSLAWLVSCHWPSNIFQAIFARIVPSICRGQIEFRVGSLSNFVNLCIWIFWMNTKNTVELRTRRTRRTRLQRSTCSNSPSGSAQLTELLAEVAFNPCKASVPSLGQRKDMGSLRKTT